MERETTRLEAFSDGVFAIALTLLILKIQVPELNNFTSSANLYNALLKLWPSYAAYILGFVTVLILWINHHGFFKYLKKINSRFLMVNGFLLLTVTFINFPTALLARYFDSPARNIASAFYCGSMVIINIAFNLLWFTAAYKRKLVKAEVTDATIVRIRNAYWMGFFIYVAAFIISFYRPFLGLFICIALWLFWTVLDYGQKKEKEEIPSSSAKESR